MKIDVLLVEEHKDGSATAKIDFDQEGLQVLVQWGLVGLLTKGLDEYAVRTEEVSFPVKKRIAKKQVKK